MQKNTDQKNSQYGFFFNFFIYVVKTEVTNFSDKNKTSTTKYDTTITNQRHPQSRVMPTEFGQ